MIASILIASSAASRISAMRRCSLSRGKASHAAGMSLSLMKGCAEADQASNLAGWTCRRESRVEVFRQRQYRLRVREGGPPPRREEALAALGANSREHHTVVLMFRDLDEPVLTGRAERRVASGVVVAFLRETEAAAAHHSSNLSESNGKPSRWKQRCRRLVPRWP
jgi:hypothetical protein